MVYRGVLFFFLFFCINKHDINAHAVYVSVCNVYEKNDNLFFSFRIFKDDIFDALGIYGESSKITDVEKSKILNYVIKNFKFKINNASKEFLVDRLVFEGSDYTETVNVVLYIQNDNISKSFYIRNTVLLDHLDSQMNVVGININEKRKTLTFKKNLDEKWIEID